MKEIWRPIKNYERYKVSNLGKILSFIRIKPTFLTFNKDKDGYYKVLLYNKNGRKLCSVHRIVAETFILNQGNKPQVNHKNGIKTDNRVENLEWTTNKENINHLYLRLPQKRTKVIYQIKNNKIIKKYKSLSEAARSLNKYPSAVSGIALCCKSKRKSYLGFSWSYYI